MRDRLVIDITRDPWGNATKIVLYFLPPPTPPTKPHIQKLVFTHRKGSKMTCTVTLSPLVGTDHVSSRQVVVTFANGTVLPPIEAFTNAAQFTCADGDTGTVVDTDFNASGSTASDPLPFTAALPLQAPTKPTVLGVTFSA